VRFTQKEIREQLTDLGAFGQEVLADHNLALSATTRRLNEIREEIEELNTEHLRQVGHLDRAVAQWTARAIAAGMSEGEVLDLLGIRPPAE
jgi:hypothetical protein